LHSCSIYVQSNYHVTYTNELVTVYQLPLFVISGRPFAFTNDKVAF
jgi:hypothetical protein